MSGKFVQIAATDEELYALDAEGRVWEYDYQEQAWEVLTAKRNPRDAEERRDAEGRS